MKDFLQLYAAWLQDNKDTFVTEEENGYGYFAWLKDKNNKGVDDED